jgi:hypothetical protein
MVFAYRVLSNGRLWWVYDGPRSIDAGSHLAYPTPPQWEFDVLESDDLEKLRGKHVRDRTPRGQPPFSARRLNHSVAMQSACVAPPFTIKR